MMSKGKLTLLRFLGQDVTLESVLSLDFTRACNFKAFLGAGFGFHLRHFLPVFNLSYLLFFGPYSPFGGWGAAISSSSER